MNLRCKIFYSILVVALIFVYSCSGKNSPENNKRESKNEGYSEIKFDTTYHDFGTLVQGEKASYTFKFTNTGNADLVIKDAYSTCGCTVPDYSKKPITPGEDGEIEVVFNSDGKNGMQYKTVTLKLNTRNTKETLTIKANVSEK